MGAQITSSATSYAGSVRVTREKATRRVRRSAALAGLSAAALLLSAGAATADSQGLPGHVVDTVCEHVTALPVPSALPDVPWAPAPAAECIQVNGWQ